jgi:hypothetical protein
VFRNNLFIGSGGTGMDFDTRMDACDFDYDGIGGFTGALLKWNNARYGTIEELRANAPVEKHLTVVDPATAFAGGAAAPGDPHVAAPLATNDLRLKPGSAAIDAGVVLANIDDGFTGKAPDLGAYELGDELPQYGPRPAAGAPGSAKRTKPAAKPAPKPAPKPAAR